MCSHVLKIRHHKIQLILECARSLRESLNEATAFLFQKDGKKLCRMKNSIPTVLACFVNPFTSTIRLVRAAGDFNAIERTLSSFFNTYFYINWRHAFFGFVKNTLFLLIPDITSNNLTYLPSGVIS